MLHFKLINYAYALVIMGLVSILITSPIHAELVSPLKQTNADIPNEMIQCNFGKLVESPNKRASCVTDDTAEKLEIRGWVILQKLFNMTGVFEKEFNESILATLYTNSTTLSINATTLSTNSTTLNDDLILNRNSTTINDDHIPNAKATNSDGLIIWGTNSDGLIILSTNSKTLNTNSKTLNINSTTITIKSPIIDFSKISGKTDLSLCIFPTTISVTVPNQVRVGEFFNVTITPSFELTDKEFDEFNKHYLTRAVFDDDLPTKYYFDIQEIKDLYCDFSAGYHVFAPFSYELSGENVTFSDVYYTYYTIDPGFFSVFNRYSYHVDTLMEHNKSVTFQMKIYDSIKIEWERCNPPENYLLYDYGVFSIRLSHIVDPQSFLYSRGNIVGDVLIYTSIDGDVVSLSDEGSIRTANVLRAITDACRMGCSASGNCP